MKGRGHVIKVPYRPKGVQQYTKLRICDECKEELEWKQNKLLRDFFTK